eukprot:ctg_166.g104
MVEDSFGGRNRGRVAVPTLFVSAGLGRVSLWRTRPASATRGRPVGGALRVGWTACVDRPGTAGDLDSKRSHRGSAYGCCGSDLRRPPRVHRGGEWTTARGESGVGGAGSGSHGRYGGGGGGDGDGDDGDVDPELGAVLRRESRPRAGTSVCGGADIHHRRSGPRLSSAAQPAGGQSAFSHHHGGRAGAGRGVQDGCRGRRLCTGVVALAQSDTGSDAVGQPGGGIAGHSTLRRVGSSAQVCAARGRVLHRHAASGEFGAERRSVRAGRLRGVDAGALTDQDAGEAATDAEPQRAAASRSVGTDADQFVGVGQLHGLLEQRALPAGECLGGAPLRAAVALHQPVVDGDSVVLLAFRHPVKAERDGGGWGVAQEPGRRAVAVLETVMEGMACSDSRVPTIATHGDDTARTRYINSDPWRATRMARIMRSAGRRLPHRRVAAFCGSGCE